MGKASKKAQSIEYRPIDQLIPHARNARNHSPEQVEQLAASIGKYGWTMPVLVDDKGEILAGHGRVLAAHHIYVLKGTIRDGLDDSEIPDGTVPVIVANGWSEARKTAYRIADNKLAENSEWDKELLALNLAALEEAGEDMGSLGFTASEMQELMSALPSRGGFLDDVATEATEEKSLDAVPKDFVELKLQMLPSERDEVVYWLNTVRDKMELNTAAEALVALARKETTK